VGGSKAYAVHVEEHLQQAAVAAGQPPAAGGWLCSAGGAQAMLIAVHSMFTAMRCWQANRI
jgi:hypothetical protein